MAAGTDFERTMREAGLRVTRPRLAVTDAGLVRRFQPAGSVARYEVQSGDNHHHAVCRTCGAITDVDCVVGSAPCLTAPDDSGYQISEAEVIYWGRCLDCATAADAEPAG